MAVLEAAACGLPIAGTEVGVLASLAPAAALGAPVGDADRLADVMLKLLAHPDAAASCGRRAREQIEGNYCVDTAADRFLQLYQRLR